MAHMNVLKRLERISRELSKVAQHMELYSGVDSLEALAVDTQATQICEQASMLAGDAREVLSHGTQKKVRLVRSVRKALGFTNP